MSGFKLSVLLISILCGVAFARPALEQVTGAVQAVPQHVEGGVQQVQNQVQETSQQLHKSSTSMLTGSTQSSGGGGIIHQGIDLNKSMTDTSFKAIQTNTAAGTQFFQNNLPGPLGTLAGQSGQMTHQILGSTNTNLQKGMNMGKNLIPSFGNGGGGGFNFGFGTGNQMQTPQYQTQQILPAQTIPATVATPAITTPAVQTPSIPTSITMP